MRPDFDAVIKVYSAIKDQYKLYKEEEHSKTTNLMYGLIAVSIFCLFTGNHDQNLLHKFALTYSIPITLLAYYWWYINDAIAFNIIAICDYLISDAQALYNTNTNLQDKLIKLQDREKAFKTYAKLNRQLSWAILIVLIIAASLVGLGVFWTNFQPPNFLELGLSGYFEPIFYWTILIIILIILITNHSYNKLSNKFFIKA